MSEEHRSVFDLGCIRPHGMGEPSWAGDVKTVGAALVRVMQCKMAQAVTATFGMCETAGDATRTRNIQLGRLVLYH